MRSDRPLQDRALRRLSLEPYEARANYLCLGGLCSPKEASHRSLVFCSLTQRTRADELQENTDDASEKSKLYYKNSMYLQFGKVRLLPGPT